MSAFTKQASRLVSKTYTNTLPTSYAATSGLPFAASVNLNAIRPQDPHGDHEGHHEAGPRADAAKVPKWASSAGYANGTLTSKTNMNTLPSRDAVTYQHKH